MGANILFRGEVIRDFCIRKTVIKANFYSVLLKTTLFRAKKVSFSLGECSFMRIEHYYICIFL